METFFLHRAPQTHYERGIFAPYSSQEEAERQVAWELHHGADPDMFEGIFKSVLEEPKFGWTQEQMLSHVSPHLVEDNREKVSTKSALLKAGKALIPKLLEEEDRAFEAYLKGIHEAISRGDPGVKNAVPGNAYSWCTGGTATATPAALSAATAKTVVYTVAASSNQHSISEIGVSFDGVTASAVPVLVELISSTTGTAGTPRAALAAGKQLRGWPAQTSQTTAADTYSAEPGTQLVNRKWLVTPNGGLFVVQFPLGREPTGLVTATTDGKAWGLRLTAPATVNAHAYMEWEE